MVGILKYEMICSLILDSFLVIFNIGILKKKINSFLKVVISDYLGNWFNFCKIDVFS